MRTYATTRQHGDRSVSRITAVLVPSVEERMRCLRSMAGEHVMQLENMIFNMLHRISEDYRGGYWDVYQLSNGGIYVAPRSDDAVCLSCENMYRAEVSAQAAGLIACAMAYSYLSLSKDGDCFGRAYLLLFDYLVQQPDAACIFSALD